MARLESAVQAEIVAYLKRIPRTKVVRVISASENGVSDLLVCHEGRFIAIEVKRHKSLVPDPEQIIFLNSVIAAGGQAIRAVGIFCVEDVLFNEMVGKEYFDLPKNLKFERL